MIDYSGLKAIFGDKLPEAHIFFATVATRKFVRNYSALRKEFGMTTAHTNRKVWNKFAKAYAEATATSPVAVTGVTLTPPTATLNPGGTQQLTATVSPAGATNKTVTFSSSKSSEVTVSSTTGLVTVLPGAQPGDTTITVTTQDGNKTATATITVEAGA
ncbi:tail protein [Yersinia phage phiR2-01]|uniref:Phage neck whiskers n=1 Tax=Yersinia phage phiR2-01 TaxID=1206557 RepID=I7J3V2_9CAUD|nr:tail protein [Yersinia phage phiR2-01]CCI88568.1 phage neck whiskers [Yersinia phage phiR2-01]